MRRLSIILLAIAIIAVPVFLKADSTESASTVGVAQEPAAAPDSIVKTLAKWGLRSSPWIAVATAVVGSLAVAHAKDSNGVMDIDHDFSTLGSLVEAQVDYRPDAIATAKARTGIP